MSRTKTLLLFLLAGALLGVVVTSWIAPGTYIWWASPGAGTSQELLNRADVIRETVAWLLRWQAIGAGIGAAVFLVLGILFVRAQAQRARRAAVPPPTPASPAGGPPAGGTPARQA